MKKCDCPRLEPRHFEIVKDETLQLNDFVYLFIVVNGSWQVEINGLLFMPGQWLKEDFAGNLPFNGTYNIRFVQDFAAQTPDTNPDVVTMVQNNPNLKAGKFLHVRLATMPEGACGCYHS